LTRTIAGIVNLFDQDEERRERERMLFADLYAAFGDAKPEIDK
jgi:hypothetical protein